MKFIFYLFIFFFFDFCFCKKTCMDILLQSDGCLTSGIYTLTNYDGTNFDTYCDFTTDGGGFTLISYGMKGSTLNNSVVSDSGLLLCGTLNTPCGSFNAENRVNTAQINASLLISNSNEMVFAWGNQVANGTVTSYDNAYSFILPNPSGIDLNLPNNRFCCNKYGTMCADSEWTPLVLRCLQGICDWPVSDGHNYINRNLNAAYGAKYGFVNVAKGGVNNTVASQCDWAIDCTREYLYIYWGVNSVGSTAVRTNSTCPEQYPDSGSIWIRESFNSSQIPICSPTTPTIGSSTGTLPISTTGTIGPVNSTTTLTNSTTNSTTKPSYVPTTPNGSETTIKVEINSSKNSSSGYTTKLFLGLILGISLLIICLVLILFIAYRHAGNDNKEIPISTPQMKSEDRVNYVEKKDVPLRDLPVFGDFHSLSEESEVESTSRMTESSIRYSENEEV